VGAYDTYFSYRLGQYRPDGSVQGGDMKNNTSAVALRSQETCENSLDTEFDACELIGQFP
jgi:hypothetical protein